MAAGPAGGGVEAATGAGGGAAGAGAAAAGGGAAGVAAVAGAGAVLAGFSSMMQPGTAQRKTKDPASNGSFMVTMISSFARPDESGCPCHGRHAKIPV